MYGFHYNFIKNYLDAELLFKDVYAEIYKHKHLFDFGNFSKDSKFYDIQMKSSLAK